MTEAAAPRATLMCLCEPCGRETNHEILHSVVSRGEDESSQIWWYDEDQMIRCLGCGTVGIRHLHKFSEDDPEDGPRESFVPPRLMRRMPSWIEDVDAEVQSILQEVYGALRNGSSRLVAMGVRSLIDAVARDNVGDRGSFEESLRALKDAGLISETEKEILDVVVDAGSAAIHRGFRPNGGLIGPLLDAAERLINHVYISGPMLREAKKNIPPRPERVRPARRAAASDVNASGPNVAAEALAVPNREVAPSPAADPAQTSNIEPRSAL